jgi:hydrogenase expression/formation protein HypC
MSCGEEHCITCGDVAVALRVVALAPDGMARCARDDGAEEAVEVTLVAPVAPGDRVLVHAGVALQRVGA